MRSRLLLVAIIVTIAVIAFHNGLFQYLKPERLGALAEASGAWGPLVVVVLFSVLQPFAVPGAIFMLTATALWPFWLAFLVNWVGATGAGMFGFAFARYFARDWVAGRLPEPLRKWDERLSSEGLPVVLLFRILFFLNPASHWALGLSHIRASTATLGTAIAFAPWIVAWTYFGEQILHWFDTQPIEWIAGVAFAIVAAVLLVRYIHRRRTTALEMKPLP